MKAIFDPAQSAYRPGRIMANGTFAPALETPERAQTFLGALGDLGIVPVLPPDSGSSALAAVHDDRYLTFLQTILPRWRRIAGAPEEVIPNLHPVSRAGEAPGGYPASAVGQVGYHIMDGAAPINAETWRSAYASAQSAVHAADLVLSGEALVYALCRPPGHHAARDLAGGFCFLNNAAIAAERLRSRYPRVAVLDVDVHHGNGTQQIFYQRADVLTVSLHADPLRFYPFFWGYADETGTGAGESCNLNIPLARGTGDDGYLAALERALSQITDFAPGALVIALGLDAHEDDPVQGLAITTKGFSRIAMRIAELRLPCVVVQEGGYVSDALGPNLRAVIEAFLAGPKPSRSDG
ncbi:histone deacetylase family protein [Pelagibius sp.]|uniref:histone deacetylase family protein n=1 Tax=Pelagibius sp. TaxID=1931238 RepID=UPI003B502375